MADPHFVVASTALYTLLVDTVSSTVTYYGKARPGSATSDPVWQIMKLTTDSSGNLVSITFGNGTSSYVNIWDNRLSLSYS